MSTNPTNPGDDPCEVRDVMTTEVVTVEPKMTLVELDRRLTRAAIGGVPVVEGDKLVGVVSRADALRALLEEQVDASRISAFYASPYPLSLPSLEGLAQESRQLADRMSHIRIEDVMTPDPETARPDEALRSVAQRMRDRSIHRMPVVDGDALVGIVTSLDLVGAIAEHGLGPA